MLLPEHPSTFECILAGLLALPLLGRAVLAFLRNLDDYRANRPRR